MSKSRAQMITFLFSAMLHEYLLAVIFRIIRPFFLGFIIGQVPLIYLTKFMKGKKSGTYLFWLGIIIGPSIIISSYLKVSDAVSKLFLTSWLSIFFELVYLLIVKNKFFQKSEYYNIKVQCNITQTEEDHQSNSMKYH